MGKFIRGAITNDTGASGRLHQALLQVAMSVVLTGAAADIFAKMTRSGLFKLRGRERAIYPGGGH